MRGINSYSDAKRAQEIEQVRTVRNMRRKDAFERDIYQCGDQVIKIRSKKTEQQISKLQ